jgi:hypothetical protein
MGNLECCECPDANDYILNPLPSKNKLDKGSLIMKISNSHFDHAVLKKRLSKMKLSSENLSILQA